jgi:predicted dehydrogenase/threonine dehydrogenase-like Zn-dependent dehydrogenase
MKQLAQRLKDGELRVVDVPVPELDDWKVLVRTHASLVSAGTEGAKVEVGRESLLGKARRRPDQVRQVLDKARADGLRTTFEAVRSRLEALSPLGYCAAGQVEQVGRRVHDVRPGDLVACGGEDAAHAEVLAVPGTLCLPVPENVGAQAAAFTTLGSIALHGFRQADLRIGERVAVVGMGLVGQLTARIAHAAGCEVMGIDLEEWRLRVAEHAGVLNASRRRSDVRADDHGRWDAVIVTAAAPASADPASLATDLATDRGNLVIVGDVKLELDRRRLYAKELSVTLARSYGPGRYDEEYEERGLDYPIEYVRWTEQRNMAEFLRLLAEQTVRVHDLITHTFSIDEADRALDAVTDPAVRSLAVMIEYPTHSEARPLPDKERAPVARQSFSPGTGVGFIGAGSFAQRELIPLAKKHGLSLERVASGSGLSAASAAEHFAFRRGASTVEDLLADDHVAGVVVATRHDLHARLTLDALRAGKGVLVEKPLCLTEAELEELRREVVQEASPPLMVGFNRRHAPLMRLLEEHLAGASGPTNVLIRVNAGALPAHHWLNNIDVGGGRLLGEGCHFIDLIAHIAASGPVAVTASASRRADEPLQAAQDFAVSIAFADGSLGTLVYGTNGAASAGKEVVEAHRGNRSGRIDDFASLRTWGESRSRVHRVRGKDKGHSEELRAFAAAVRGDAPAPAATSYLASTALTLAALRSLERGGTEAVGEPATRG